MMSNETHTPTSASQNTTSGCCGGARKNAAAEAEARYHALRTLIAAVRATDNDVASPAPAKKSCCCG